MSKITKLLSFVPLLNSAKISYPIIRTSESIILKRGEVVGTQQLHYCVAPLVIGREHYAFMHFEGHVNKKHDEEMLREVLNDLKNKYGEKDLSAIIYSLPNYDGDDYSGASLKSRNNEENVKGILNSHNIHGKTLFGSARDIVVSKDCKIVSELKYKLTSLPRQLF